MAGFDLSGFHFDGWNLNDTEVDLSESNITSEDLIIIVEKLMQMPNLVTLDLSSNKITTIEALSQLTNLTTLYLDSNQIITVESLSGLIKLTILILMNNQITT